MSKKQQKIKQIKKERLMSTLKWILILGFIFGLFFLLVSIGIEQKKPQGQDFSNEILIQDNTGHVTTTTVLGQPGIPPTSGPHFGQVATSGFRDTEIPDGHIVHNLEHGDIWISYNPRISPSIAEELRQFLDGKVIITPRAANDNDIALSAWGRSDTFDLDETGLPIERIKDFIKRYKYAGPEKITTPSKGI